MKKGLVHIYTGNGKGKTTAAMGLALRAAGCGLNVRIFQFMKSSPSGELNSIASLNNIVVRRAENQTGKFAWDMTPEEKEAFISDQQILFDEACDAACSEESDLVILDEALSAMREGVMDAKALLYLMEHKWRGTELVITGRGAPEPLIRAADYVTEMQPVKHPYDRGTHARRGIEY